MEDDASFAVKKATIEAKEDIDIQVDSLRIEAKTSIQFVQGNAVIELKDGKVKVDGKEIDLGSKGETSKTSVRSKKEVSINAENIKLDT